MLGTRRRSVTVAAGLLQKAGLITYTRGHVPIEDGAGLKNAASVGQLAGAQHGGQIHKSVATYIMPASTVTPSDCSDGWRSPVTSGKAASFP
jgi:hypothetical protein